MSTTANNLTNVWASFEALEQLPQLLELVQSQPEIGERLAQAELANPTDKPRALAALLMQAEVLLRKGEGKSAVLVLGKALGLQEWMGQEFSALTLAMLAEAQVLWGHSRKAQQTAAKALERSDHAYTSSRANWAMFKATGELNWLEKARAEALGFPNWQSHLLNIDD